MRTHLPEKVPQWFLDYKKANDMWLSDVYSAIKQLYDDRNAN